MSKALHQATLRGLRAASDNADTDTERWVRRARARAGAQRRAKLAAIHLREHVR